MIGDWKQMSKMKKEAQEEEMMMEISRWWLGILLGKENGIEWTVAMIGGILSRRAIIFDDLG